ncbi:hypothetical protein F5Y19DRAFT_437224 [Xylariaceae sp. FL1651]|nr:hypothetical protein F5Y19DRAFT_437224 [Xylariaceae sp. FL1651]
MNVLNFDKASHVAGHNDKHKSISGLIETLDSELACFNDNSTPLFSSQLDSYTSAYKLVTENTDNNLSRQRRSERARARDLLTDVFLILGSEVFLLCAIAIPTSKLTTIDSRVFIQQLRVWWASSPRPRGLTTHAASLCSSVATHLVTARKRKFSEIGVNDYSETYFTPYCTSLLVVDLQSFLETHGTKYKALTLRVQEDEKLPCIEISSEMCQGLIMHAIARTR